MDGQAQTNLPPHKNLMVDFLAHICHEGINPIALRKAKIVHNFGLSECNRVKGARQNNAKQSIPVLLHCH